MFTPMLSPEKCGYMLTSNLGMTQQCQNKNLTKNDTKKVLKNVGMIQQCWNKNLTKDDTNKVQTNVGKT